MDPLADVARGAVVLLAIWGAVALVPRLARGLRRRVEPPASAAAVAPPPDEATRVLATVRQIAAEVEPYYEGSASPADMLDNARFVEAAELLRAGPHPSLTLLAWQGGDAALLACMALEALARRAPDAEVAARLLRAINVGNYWVRHFALRALDAHHSAPVLAAVLVRLDERWTGPIPLTTLRAFAEARLSRESPAFGALLDDLDAAAVKRLAGTLESLHDNLSPGLAVEVARASATKLDRAVLAGLGRLWWGAETSEPMEIPDDRLATLEAALGRGRSVVVVGEPGVGKTTLVRAVAHRQQRSGWTIFEATAADINAGQIYVGELEGRVRTLVDAVRGKRLLWVVPNFHELAWAGRTTLNPRSILDLILPAIERGEMRVIGESTPDAWARLVQWHRGAATVFESQRLTPMDDAATLEVARGWAQRHPTRDGLPAIDEPAIGEALAIAKTYLGDTALPGGLMTLLEGARQRLTAGKPHLPASLTSGALLETLSEKTGLPLVMLDDRQRVDLGELRRIFESRVLGQPEAVDCLVERVAMIKAGLTDSTRPTGVFLFVGPTGTGKTEIARCLAVEKAHPAVWDLFLQVFDAGRLTDRRGNTADFRHAIVIMTSNLGATLPHGTSIGFLSGGRGFAAAGVERAVGQAFRREFVNRIDRVVVFQPLSRATMREILRKELEAVLRRRGLRNRAWAVEWEQSALDFLLEKGFTRDLGARPLKRAVEQYVLAPLAVAIVDHQTPEGDQFLFVRREGDRLGVQFVDPDAPEPAPEPVEAPPTLRLETVAFDARGTAAEGAFLAVAYERLAAQLAEPGWAARKQEALARTTVPSFWESPERFAVLGAAEYMDRIEAGLETAGSLLHRLRQPRGEGRKLPSDLVRRLAQQLYLVAAAYGALEAGEAHDAFVLVTELYDAGVARSALANFAFRLGQMYRRWGDARRMRVEVLEEAAGAGPYRLLLAVSGFAAYAILKPETGLHILEVPQDERSFARIRARVCVVPQPDEPARGEALRKQASDALEGEIAPEPTIVRRYRETPSPLVRDGVRGWRTGRIDRVLDGDFDLI